MPPKPALDSLRDMDLYKLFDITEDATKESITKAYRKKALKVHPDKNPDNPKAAETFHLLTQTLEVLTDVAARAAYDRCRKAKKITEERNNHLDAKRRKLKEDLEKREFSSKSPFSHPVPSAAAAKTVVETPMSQFEREVLRLRKEGSRLVEAEQERLRQELKEQMASQKVIHLDLKQDDGPRQVRIEPPAPPPSAKPAKPALSHDEFEAKVLARMANAAKRKQMDLSA